MKVMTMDVLIANELKYMIKSESMQPGDKLPSERKLSEILKAQRLTVRSGLKILLREGVISVKERSGYYINEPRVKRDVFHIDSTFEELTTKGINLNTTVIDIRTMEVNKELSSKMKMILGTKVCRLERVRSIYGIAISLDISYLPCYLVPEIEKYDFTRESLYNILSSKYKLKLHYSKQAIEIVEASKNESDKLKVKIGDRLVFQSGLVYNKEDELIEYSESFMIPKYFVYESS